MLKCHLSTNFTLAEKAITLHIYYTLQSWKREERSYHVQYHIPIIYMWVLGSNPYKRIHLGRGDESMSLYKYLTPAELQMLEDCPMPTPSLERIRDLFLFQTYTCLSYVDLMGFDVSRIQEIEGMKTYTGKRGKTGKPFTVPLVPKALLILEKYGFSLPHISNVKYNEYLKKVSSACNINKPLSTHWARHTGATLFLNMGIDMGIVSRICGHSSIRITEKTYARLLDETVVSAVKKILK